jgi:hypothetical protein
MKYFLYHRRSRPTGQVIGESLNIGHGLYCPNSRNDVLIRWGCRKQPHLDHYSDLVLNNVNAIGNASDKLNSLIQMKELGIRVPDFDTEPEALVQRVGYPILGRKQFHARATDVKLCLQKRDFRKPLDYYIQYIPTVREYRVHVVRDKVIRIQGKFLDYAADAVPHIRNFGTGYRFRSPRKRLRQERLDIAVNAVKSLGLDFGAVDLLVADDSNSYVLEVNTAPSCSPLTATEYLLQFQDIADIPMVNVDYLQLLSPDQDEMDTEDEENEDLTESEAELIYG